MTGKGKKSVSNAFEPKISNDVSAEVNAMVTKKSYKYSSKNCKYYDYPVVPAGYAVWMPQYVYHVANSQYPSPQDVYVTAKDSILVMDIAQASKVNPPKCLDGGFVKKGRKFLN